VIEDAWISRLLCEVAFSWQLRKLLCGLKTLLIFSDFAILNILCLKIHITLIFMHSSSDEFMHITTKTRKQMFLLVSGGHICAPRRDTSMASPYTKLYTSGQNVFPNILFMNYSTDLILGKAFCIFIFFHFPDAELSVLTGLHFYFWNMTKKTHKWIQHNTVCPCSICYVSLPRIKIQQLLFDIT